MTSWILTTLIDGDVGLDLIVHDGYEKYKIMVGSIELA